MNATSPHRRPGWQFAAALCLLVLPTLRAADPPHLIPFQGHLARPSAADPTKFEPVASGQYDILFTLYAAPVGGESKVWGPERHRQVTVVQGLLNALLGSVIGFETTLQTQPNFFRRPLYVGITVDADGNPNTADLELVPRQVLLPAVQALNANSLDGADWTRFFVGTDGEASYTPGLTKARDADLFDGIDAGAVFVDPLNTAVPKVKHAALADAISGNLGITGDLNVSGALSAGNGGTFQGPLTVNGPSTLQGDLTVTGLSTFQGQVSSVVGGLTHFMVPRGAIILWSGDAAAIPDGWAVCDGSNGTPDLRDRFVLGLGATGVPGMTGGTINHQHNVDIDAFDSGNGIQTGAFGNGGGGGTATHHHTINPPNTPTTAVNHLPPFIVLAYIMKL